MTCKIERPAPQELFDRLKNMFSATVLGGAPVIPESNEHYVVANDYAMMEQFYAIADQAARERDPRYACCENLYKMAARNGVYPYPASFSQGYVRLSGTANAPLPNTIEVEANGQTYRSTGNVPARLGANGSIVIRVRALQPGPDGNAAGQASTGSLVTAIAGVERTVDICGGQFCGGREAEECEVFRQRYLGRLAYKPRATQAWIMEKLLEWPCATRVYQRSGSCCECNQPCDENDCGCKDCGGALGFYVLFDGIFDCGIPPAEIVAQIQEWMFGQRQGFGEGQAPIGVCGTVHNITPLPVNVRIDIPVCVSQTELREIREQVSEFFTTIAPSQPLSVRQISVIVSNIIGADKQFNVMIDPVGTDDSLYTVDLCGNLEPACDVLPCLNEIEILGPTSTMMSPCG